jgi:hypothetical protein
VVDPTPLAVLFSGSPAFPLHLPLRRTALPLPTVAHCDLVEFEFVRECTQHRRLVDVLDVVDK